MKKRTIYIIIAIVIVLALALLFSGKITGFAPFGGDVGKCTETDDRMDYYVAGSSKYENRDKVYEDVCFAKSFGREKWLKEYYCNSVNRLVTKRYLCPNGCQDGACIE